MPVEQHTIGHVSVLKLVCFNGSQSSPEPHPQEKTLNPTSVSGHCFNVVLFGFTHVKVLYVTDEYTQY